MNSSEPISEDEHREVARQLHEWFEQLFSAIGRSVFDMAPEGAHRAAIVLNVLTRNARRFREASLDREGALYTPLCFLLAAGCKYLDMHLDKKHWEAALANVTALFRQVAKEQAQLTSMGLTAPNPAEMLKEQVDEALLHAGIAGRATTLEPEGQHVALGLAINWGIRFLCAYARDCDGVELNEARHDLAWIRTLLAPLLAPASTTSEALG